MNAAKMVLLTAIGMGTAAMIGCNEPPTSSTEENVEQASSALGFAGPSGGSTGTGSGTTSDGFSRDDNGPFFDCVPLAPSVGNCSAYTTTCDYKSRLVASAILALIQRAESGLRVEDVEVRGIVPPCAFENVKAMIQHFGRSGGYAPTLKLACGTNVPAYLENVNSCADWEIAKKGILDLGLNPYFHVAWGKVAGMNLDFEGQVDAFGQIFIDPIAVRFGAGGTGDTNSATVPASDATTGASIPPTALIIPPGTQRWTEVRGAYANQVCVKEKFGAFATPSQCKIGYALENPYSAGRWRCVTSC
jgi:hypothetical protein